MTEGAQPWARDELLPPEAVESGLTDDELVERLRAVAADNRGQVPDRDAVRKRFAVGAGRADRLRELTAQECEEVTAP